MSLSLNSQDFLVFLLVHCLLAACMETWEWKYRKNKKNYCLNKIKKIIYQNFQMDTGW